MATVNFSIPDEVKNLFNEAFTGKNRSAVIADLMRAAAEHELLLRHRREAVAEVLQERDKATPVAAEKVREALRDLR